MSLIRIFCKECGNDGKPGADGRGGFETNIMTTVLINNAGSMYADEVRILGHEPISHPVEAVFDAYKRNGLTCLDCGSSQVDVVCEADLKVERDEQLAVDRIIVDEFVPEIAMQEDIKMPAMELGGIPDKLVINVKED